MTSPASSAGSVTTAPSTCAGPPRSACSPTHNAPSTSPPALPTAPPTAQHLLNGSRGTLFLHVTTDDLADGTGGRVEQLGPATLQLLQDWISRVSSFTIRPVLDLARTDTADPHDPPAWMRETVILRDRHCVFPGCGIDARSCDLDHIRAYLPPDDGGPPGQTTPANLACLCRRHHRLKTFTAWRYRRLPDNTYEWTNPYGHTHLVTAGQ